MQKLSLQGRELDLRITKKQVKNAKVKFGIDLQVLDMGNVADSNAMQVLQDPIYLTECFWAFYEERLVGLGFTQDSFDDCVDETNIEAIRDGFVNSCAAFFPFLRIIAMTFAASLPGLPSIPQPPVPPSVT